MAKRLYASVALLLALIMLASALLTCFTATVRPTAQGMRVVTSFYPVYIAALNVAGDIDGVDVINLVNNGVGCLHDYQMSPTDRVTLQSADVLVKNGAGAEPFLETALETLPDLTVIDLSEGQTLLQSEHTHSHGALDEAEEHEEDEDHDHDHEDDVFHANGHLWVSPVRYRQQVESLCAGLVCADPAHADAYRDNTARYLVQIDRVIEEMTAASAALSDRAVVVVHDSLCYLAHDLSLPIVSSLGIGEESGASAAALSAAQDALRASERALLLYDAQYETTQYSYLQTVCPQTASISVDICVAGSGEKDAWIRAMDACCAAMREAAA